MNIIEAIKESGSALTTKGMARYMGVDATSEALNELREQAWELVASGELIAYDTRDQPHGMLAFGLAEDSATCLECGNELELVRPGKHQCNFCEAAA